MTTIKSLKNDLSDLQNQLKTLGKPHKAVSEIIKLLELMNLPNHDLHHLAASVRESQVLAITNAYRSKNLEALKAALSDTGKVGKLTKETLFEACKNLNLIMRSKATLKGTKEMLINAVAEANRRDNRK